MFTSEQDFSFKQFFIPLTLRKIISIIAVVGFLVFFNMLFNDFVWDDKTYILNNLQTHQINFLLSFGKNIFNDVGQYRPIPATYFSFLYRLFGDTSFFYHLLQLLLHITCTVFVYLIFRKYLSVNIAFLLTLLFLVHPIQVESVSYIAQTVSSLFLVFGLISLLLLTSSKISKKIFFISFSLLLFSLLTKETGVLFLLLLILYTILFKQQNTIKVFTGSIFILCIYFYFRIFVGQVGFSIRPLIPIASLSLSERFIHIPAIIFYYLKIFFFPNELAIDQQWIISSSNFSTFYLPLFVDVFFFTFLILAGLLIYKYDKQIIATYVFFAAWFLGGIFFHLQIFPLDMTVADRWFYMPMIGLLGMFGLILQSVIPKLLKYKTAGIIFAVTIIFALSIRTILRNSNWQNAIDLYSHDMQISNNYNLEYNLGIEYVKMKKYTQAIHHFKKSVALRPYELNLRNLGAAYADNGNIQKAKIYTAMALQAKDYNLFFPHKHDSATYTNYAAFLVFFDDPFISERFIQDSLRDYPDNLNLLVYLALAKYLQHDKKSALRFASQAYNLHQNNTTSYLYNSLQNNQPFQFSFKGKTIQFDE